MNPKEIGSLYEDLSEHFEVPMPEWKILTRSKITKKQINQLVQENRELLLGKFLAKMEELLPPDVVINVIHEENDIDIEKEQETTIRKLEFGMVKGRFLEEPTPKIVFFWTLYASP